MHFFFEQAAVYWKREQASSYKQRQLELNNHFKWFFYLVVFLHISNVKKQNKKKKEMWHFCDVASPQVAGDRFYTVIWQHFLALFIAFHYYYYLICLVLCSLFLLHWHQKEKNRRLCNNSHIASIYVRETKVSLFFY